MSAEVSVGIVAKAGNEPASELAGVLASCVRSMGTTVRVDERTGASLGRQGVPVGALSSADLVVSIGGDGTFLFVARKVGGTPVVGVNLGEVGFLNAVSPTDAEDVVRSLVEVLQDGSLSVTYLDRLQASGDDWSLAPALNDVVVQGARRGPAGGGRFDVSVDGSHYHTIRGDGLIVSTPTGSTAYNRSEGGPLVAPDAAVQVITGMSPIETVPPLVVEKSATVTIDVSDCETAAVVGDGRETRRLTPPETVTVEEAAEPVRRAGPTIDFYAALSKIHETP